MNYKEIFKNEVLCEIRPHNFNYSNAWDCEFNRLLNLSDWRSSQCTNIKQFIECRYSSYN